MQISLFTCTAENERVDKSEYISNRFVLEGAFRNESSIQDPVIIIEKTNPPEFHYNYMYIEEFKRWYYINDFITKRTGIWEIHAHVDVLYTWRADIGKTEGVIDKCENPDTANPYFDDGSFILDCRNDLEIKEFSNGFNENGSYILICAGGV